MHQIPELSESILEACISDGKLISDHISRRRKSFNMSLASPTEKHEKSVALPEQLIEHLRTRDLSVFPIYL